MDRRELLMRLLAGAAAGPTGVAARATFGQPGGAHEIADRPAAIGVDDGELVYVGRDPVRIKIAPRGQGTFGMITQEVSAGTSIPVHLHESEDELIFIRSGVGQATLADRRVPLAAGSTLLVPRGTWHGGRNTGTEVLDWIAIYSPSGFEGYFREIGRRTLDEQPQPTTPADREARDRKYGIRYRR
jgi:mannose-6-phosphate isomerase-like protein (cupin superfamily)